MSQGPVPEQTHSTPIQGATRWLLLMGGLLLLGAATVLLLFGNDLWNADGGRGDESRAAAQAAAQAAPQFEPLEVGTPRYLGPPLSIGSPPEPGDAAPPFLLVDLHGEEVALAQFRGQPVILNFWATWCAPCIFEMPELQAAYEAHSDEGLVILGLNRDESESVVADFLANDLDVNITFPILLDEHAVVADGYGVLNMPTTYFIDGDGIVSAVHRGPLTVEQIDAFLANMS